VKAGPVGVAAAAGIAAGVGADGEGAGQGGAGWAAPPGRAGALGSLPLVANGITSFGEFTEVIPAGEVPGTPV
jgi:hypothetical protein